MSKTNMLFQFLLNQIRGYKEDRGDSRRFRNYYMSNKEDTRGDVAKIVDFIVSRAMIFFMVFIVTFLQIPKIPLTLIITGIVVTIYHMISIKLRNKRLEIMKTQKRRAIASQKVYQEIMNNTVEELRTFIMGIFSSMEIEKLKHKRSSHNTIVLEGEYHDEKIMITTLIYKNDFYVELKELKEFIHQLKEENCRKGIIVTTSDFTKDCYQYFRQENDEFKVVILNKESFLSLIEKSEMFPTEEEIDELVENKISRKEAIWEKYKNSMLAHKKSKSYFLLSLFLIATAYYTPYPKYYIIVASGTMTLTLIILFLKMVSKKTVEEDDWEILNKKFNEL